MRLILMTAAFAAVAFPALAQAVADAATTVDLTPLLNALITLVGVAVAALAALAGRYFHQKTGIDLKLGDNAILDAAIDRGLDYARAKATEYGHLDVKSELLATAAGYVMSGAPVALKRFGITEARLKQMIEARLAPKAGA